MPALKVDHRGPDLRLFEVMNNKISCLVMNFIPMEMLNLFA